MQSTPAIVLSVLLVAVLARLALGQDDAAEATPEPPPGFERFALDALRTRRAESGRAYLSFLDRSTLTCGLYHLPAGAKDGQSPHERDEVYYVIAGRARFTAGERTVDVASGDVLFVAAREEHRFHDIAEDLDLLVFFSTAKPGGDGDGD